MPDDGLTTLHRGGTGTPLVLLHGLGASWRVWRPVLGILEAQHEVFALTLPGHNGCPLEAGTTVSVTALADLVESELDRLGIGSAHIAGNSLGGWIAVELGRRGRARSVVALSPAGAWTRARDLRRVVRMVALSHAITRGRQPATVARALARPRLRRLALRSIAEHGERISPSELLALLEDSVGCAAFDGFLAWIRTAAPIALGPEPLDYPVRIAWAQRDRLIPFARYGRPYLQAIPGAEHITLRGVGHVPMFDDPALIARTILELTRRTDHDRSTAMTTSTDIKLDGAQEGILVRRWDPDRSPRRVVVVVHGYGEHSGRYEHVARRLADEGAVVYAPDHRGHGHSAGERALVGDIETLVDDVAAVIATARAAHPGLAVSLLGHSMGGIVATRYAQREGHGLTSLVLSGPVIGGNPEIEGLLQLDPIPDVAIDGGMLSRDPAVGEAYAADPLVYHGPFLRPTLEAIFAGVWAIAAGPTLGSLPTLWIHGEEDPLAPLAPTRAAIERIRGDGLEEQIYAGARHEVFNETNREEILDEVAAFLDARVVAPR